MLALQVWSDAKARSWRGFRKTSEASFRLGRKSTTLTTPVTEYEWAFAIM